MTVGEQPPGAHRHRPPDGTGAGTRRVRTWLANRPVQQYAYAGGAVLLAVTGLFGGLRTVDVALAPLVVGRPIVADPLTVTITRSSWTTDLGPPGKADPGQRYLIVAGTVRNDTDTSVGLDILQDAVHLQGVAAVYQNGFGDDVGPSETATPWGIFVTADSSRLSWVGPGLTYETAWVFRQQDTRPAPTSVTVEVDGHTYRTDTIDATTKWLDPEAVATGSLPMKPSGS